MNESWYYYWYSQWIFGITEFVVMYILFLRLDTRYQVKCDHAGAHDAFQMFSACRSTSRSQPPSSQLQLSTHLKAISPLHCGVLLFFNLRRV
jgi:hypothetical protein